MKPTYWADIISDLLFKKKNLIVINFEKVVCNTFGVTIIYVSGFLN